MRLIVLALLVACGSTELEPLDEPDPGMLVEEADASLWNRVFVREDLGLGLGSLHFNDVDDVYVSYANAPVAWKLDSGALFPPFLR